MMEIKTLYRYERADGGKTVGPVFQEGAEELSRIIAEEGKLLKNIQTGETGYVFDAENVDEFEEIEDPDAVTDGDAAYTKAAKILLGEEV